MNKQNDMRTISKIMMGFFIGMMMSLVFSSCAKEDQYRQTVLGAWKISHISTTVYENGVEIKTDVEDNYFANFYFDFKSDGTLKVFFDEEIGVEPKSVTWLIENGKMIFKDVPQNSEEEFVFDIVELKKSSMILSTVDEEYEEGGNKYKIIGKMYFTRN